MKKFFKKYAPKKSSVNLNWMGKWLQNPCIWYWNRNSISKGFAVGLFCAFLPIPFQMILATILAVIFSANILLSMSLVWITNPITTVPIFYFLYRLGCVILNEKIQPYSISSWEYIKEIITSWESIKEIMTSWESIQEIITLVASIMPALLTGSIIFALTSAIISYTVIQWIYLYKASKRIRRRKS